MPDEFRKAQITGNDVPRAAVKEQTQQAAKHVEDSDQEAVETWEQENNTREQENLDNLHLNGTDSQETLEYTTETETPENTED